MEKRVIDTREYVSALQELTEEGREVSMVIAGGSMVPFLVHERDIISFKKPDRELKVGDMVFFQRSNGDYIMHRIWKVKTDGYYIVGDAQEDIEGPVKREQIFAIVTKVRRKGKWIEAGNFWWEFFEHIWIKMVPLRRVVLKIYNLVIRLY